MKFLEHQSICQAVALVVSTVMLRTVAAENNTPDYLIVGAGGSGIQLALFFEKYGMEYQVLEKEDVVGSFWTKFPVFGEMISVNKLTRNPKERLRYGEFPVFTATFCWARSKIAPSSILVLGVRRLLGSSCSFFFAFCTQCSCSMTAFCCGHLFLGLTKYCR